MLYKDQGLTKIYNLSISLRFNIDNIKPFPIQYPWINTNFNSGIILSEPIKITTYIKSTGIDVIKKLETGELQKVFIYI